MAETPFRRWFDNKGWPRIIIGATSLADARASLGLGVALARRRAAMLVGMLADDAGWAGIMAAPSRLISLGGDPVAPPGADALRRILTADARAR